jgi:hypothetical protein
VPFLRLQDLLPLPPSPPAIAEGARRIAHLVLQPEWGTWVYLEGLPDGAIETKGNYET